MQDKSTLTLPGRRYRRSSSLEEDEKKLQQLRRAAESANVSAQFSETAPGATFFFENRCRTVPKLNTVPQSQPERHSRYLPNNSQFLLSGHRSNPGSCETLVVQCNLCCEEYCEQEPRMIPRNLSCGHTYCSGLSKVTTTNCNSICLRIVRVIRVIPHHCDIIRSFARATYNFLCVN